MNSALADVPVREPSDTPRTYVLLYPDAWGDALDEVAASTEIAPDLLRDVILPNRLLSSADCLDVYRRMFVARVEQILTLELPAVRDVLGEDGFSELVRDYVLTYPAGHEDLSRASDNFPEYLGQSGLLPRERGVWLSELARLERAIAIAAKMEGSDALDVADLDDGRLGSARFEGVASLDLFAFQYRVDDVYSSWLHGAPVGTPAQRPQWLAIVRQGTQVQRMPMTRRAWLVLSEILLGSTLEAAIAERFGRIERASVLRRADAWLRAWISNGLFRTVQPG